MAVIPVLIAYLLLVLLVGGFFSALPALLPIGVTIFIVNRKEFKLSKDEMQGTLLVIAIGIGLIIWGATKPVPRAEPAPREYDQAGKVQVAKPAPKP